MALQALGKTVLPMSFPRYGETFFGTLLQGALRGDHGDFANFDPYLASVFYALDRASSKDEIRGALASGGYVVCDRYASANQIHQGGKFADPEKRATFLAWLDALEFEECEIPKPDLSIYLDVPPSVSEENMSGKTKDLVERNPWYLRNSHESAQWLMSRQPEKWVHVRCAPDGVMRDRDEVHLEIMRAIHDVGIL